MTYVDLHIHSYFSDGTMSPEEILLNAIRSKVKVIAVTDHNVLDGSRQLLNLCENTDVQCITGVELDAVQNDNNFHIIGYGVDLNDDLFSKRVESNCQLLEEVNLKLIEKMQLDYKEVSLEEYLSFSYQKELGGWKTLHYFKDKGLVHNLADGFNFYKKYNHYYTCVDFPNIQTVSHWIHEAGGVAVLAHPGRVIKKGDAESFKQSLLQIVELGIDGIECYYPSHTQEETSICLNICKLNDLLVTSGSDCHGTFEETCIGELHTRVDEVNLKGLSSERCINVRVK